MPVLNDELKLYRGERKTFVADLKDSAGVGIDIAGASLYFTVRSEYPAGSVSDDTDNAVLFTKTVGSGITFVPATDGRFEILVDKSDTNTIEIGAAGKGYFYGIEIVEVGQSDPKTLASGIFTLLSDVVRGV